MLIGIAIKFCVSSFWFFWMAPNSCIFLDPKVSFLYLGFWLKFRSSISTISEYLFLHFSCISRAFMLTPVQIESYESHFILCKNLSHFYFDQASEFVSIDGTNLFWTSNSLDFHFLRNYAVNIWNSLNFVNLIHSHSRMRIQFSCSHRFSLCSFPFSLCSWPFQCRISFWISHLVNYRLNAHVLDFHSSCFNSCSRSEIIFLEVTCRFFNK